MRRTRSENALQPRKKGESGANGIGCRGEDAAAVARALADGIESAMRNALEAFGLTAKVIAEKAKKALAMKK